MIVVIEGVSAAGKTTWCRTHAAGHTVHEIAHIEAAPDADLHPSAAAVFWSDQNVERWQAALATERSTGLVVCDTDPLKLHYAWSLWQIGVASEQQWLGGLAETRRAFSMRKIGFADAYFIKRIDPELARRQREGDGTRRRGNFELHLRLQDPLVNWYQAIGTVLPQTVHWGWPEQRLDPSAWPSDHKYRYDLDAFDGVAAALASFRNPGVPAGAA